MHPGLVGAMLFACSSDPQTGFQVCIVTQRTKTPLFLEELADKVNLLGRQISIALLWASCKLVVALGSDMVSRARGLRLRHLVYTCTPVHVLAHARSYEKMSLLVKRCVRRHV